MKNIFLVTTFLLLFDPAGALAGDQKPDTNVNERYTIESVELSGADEDQISKALHDDMQKLVGEKFSQDAANELIKRLRKELPGYSITIKLRRGEKPEKVKLIFDAEKIKRKWFELPIPPVLYHSKQGFSGSIDIPIEFHHNIIAFGLVDSADELLERNAGFRVRYEHTKLGTDRLGLKVTFDSYHQKWNPATEAALGESPEVPGIYRTRQDVAPTLSFVAWHDLKVSSGFSFQQFETQYPETHTEKAHSWIADIQYGHDFEGDNGVGQHISASYSMRTATRVLDSDFVYTRHFWIADYAISKGRNLIGVHFRGGLITGTAPLFERFSLGNSFTLRGWNKFDVAPLGGTRAAHGSLEYRYRPLQVFYDVGTVWDAGQPAGVRHALGFGLAFKNGIFGSLAFPLREQDPTPIFMVGCRY